MCWYDASLMCMVLGARVRCLLVHLLLHGASALPRGDLLFHSVRCSCDLLLRRSLCLAHQVIDAHVICCSYVPVVCCFMVLGVWPR